MIVGEPVRFDLSSSDSGTHAPGTVVTLGPDFDEFKEGLNLANDLWRDERRRERFEEGVGGLFEKIRPFVVRETKATAGAGR